ncbi:uncharacterized protein RCO7_14956 [Rhynchosporium graminicola]|uniref:Uncharacterized protein n=1 Tax=Rhynchosporium graminicola TaxID=2792576 RepID=A0A1E1LC07_9HELO|nr:uncharacterized protein RCO7_14956 [Rhynchosporium commune]
MASFPAVKSFYANCLSADHFIGNQNKIKQQIKLSESGNSELVTLHYHDDQLTPSIQIISNHVLMSSTYP